MNLALLIAIIAPLACTTQTEEGQSDAHDAITGLADESQARFIETQGLEEKAEWFRNMPFSSSGIPMLLFRVFSDFAPEIWGSSMEHLPQLGLSRNDIDGQRPLPLGLGYQRTSKALVAGTEGTPIDVTSFQVVGITCGGCHISKLTMPGGKSRFLLGSGSTQFDPNAFGEAVYKTVTKPDFNGARFRELIRQRQNAHGGPTTYAWEFNSKNPLLRAQQDLEYTLFMNTTRKVKHPVTGAAVNLSDLMVEGVKARVLDRQGTINRILEPLYGSHPSRLHGGTPGQADAIGKAAVVSNSRPLTAAVVDLPAIWRQDTREYAQYDGSIRDPFFRNLGATTGVSGSVVSEANREKGCSGPIEDCVDQHELNIANAYFLGDFVRRLPAPKYPFAVDAARARRGQVLFARHCATCHSMPDANSGAIVPKTVRVPFDQDVGADEARARQLDSAGVGKVAAMLKRACKAGDRKVGPVSVPDAACDANPADILFDQTERPAYMGQALPGVWATAPYLHNGSVPNLRTLLVPSRRPTRFWRGNTTYDARNVGWADAKEPGVSTSIQYDTTIPGSTNRGHSAPAMLGNKDWGADPGALDDLLEYMKTL